MHFYTCSNNGVTAIISEGVYQDIQKHVEIYKFFYTTDEKPDVDHKDRWRAALSTEATQHLTTPIFTFVRNDRFRGAPWFTGDDTLFKVICEHIRDNGGTIEHRFFNVPFSNGAEVGMHGKEEIRYELAYVTTRRQFFETFGVELDDLIPK